jgi:hypothetical protein
MMAVAFRTRKFAMAQYNVATAWMSHNARNEDVLMECANVMMAPVFRSTNGVIEGEIVQMHLMRSTAPTIPIEDR